MKPRAVLCGLFAAVGVLAAAAAFGGVTDTKHDMVAMGKTVAGAGGRGVCSYCHVPHGAQGDRLWAGEPATGYTPVANLCGTCHLSSAVVDFATESENMFKAGAHGFDETVIEGTDRYGQGTDLAGSGLPYTNDDTGVSGTDIDCTSCHDPHSDTAGHRPFLRAPITSLCQMCHADRENTGTMATNTNGAASPYSQHPVGATYTGGVDRPISWNQPYQVPMNVDDNGTAGGATASLAAAGKWYLGGHRTGTDGTSGGVTCVTCHIVHGDDPSATYGGSNSLPATDLLVNQKVSGTTADDLCIDCHTTNPGGTNASHPVYGTSTFQGSVTGNDLNIDTGLLGDDLTPPSGVYTDGNGGIACLSCHDTHFGENNTPILADTTVTSVYAFCEGCHASDTNGDIITARAHHPRTGSTQYDTATYENIADATDFYSQELQCETCHRAHNAVDQDATNANIPDGPQFLLRAPNYDTATGQPESRVCVACHSVNPARFKYNLGQAGELGSHWVSAANSIVTADDNATPDLDNLDSTTVPALQTNYSSTVAIAPIRTTNWPSTGLDYAGSGNQNSFSKVGGQDFSWTAGPTHTSTNPGGLICESCHSITNPREADWLLLGEFDATARNTSDNVTAYTATTETAQGGDGLCLGCHGIPAGTHPTTGSTVSRTGNPLSTGSAFVANPPQTGGTTEAFYPGTDQMTCTSCHDVHSGNTGAAIYILKEGNSGADMGNVTTLSDAVRAYTGGTVDPGLNFTDLCAACHTGYQ